MSPPARTDPARAGTDDPLHWACVYALRAIDELARARRERRDRAFDTRRRLRREQRLAIRSGLVRDIRWVFREPKMGESAEWEWARCEFLAGVTDPGVGRSGWLVSWAVRVIPIVERARYREEFEAELLEIGGGWRRFGHAVRVLGRAVPLRWELRRPARERAR